VQSLTQGGRASGKAVWTLEEETCEILEVKFHKSVIKSVAAMTYGQAQDIIDAAADQSPLAKDLRLMRDITRKLRAKRTAAGALTLASPEVRFELDSETHDPVDVGEYQLRETNKMVEEMMLLANISVAKRIQENFPGSAMLRRHPAPPPANFEQLEKVEPPIPLLEPSSFARAPYEPASSVALARWRAPSAGRSAGPARSCE
jgi:exosome complex exonuclease DIS3/RRP44